MPDPSKKIGLFGAGKMGFALFQGWMREASSASRFFVWDPVPSADLEALHNKQILINPQADEIAPLDLMVVAVKPQILADELPTIKTLVTDTTVVISVVAGKTIGEFADALHDQQPIVRTMPNTPSIVGAGITALFANDHVEPPQKETASELLTAVGQVVWLAREDQMDAVTAVSGSGPAYVFHLTECIEAAAIDQGLSPDLAAQLARATVSGAGALMAQSPESAGQLRENVTSPGGTTAAALEVLMDDKALESLLKRAIDAATKRSIDLGK